MIKIYCLIDPRNNHPFYVGATKSAITTRLSQHIHEALHRRDALRWPDHALKHQRRIGRLKLVNTLLDAGMKPKIQLLVETHVNATDYYEQFFFNLLTKQGYDIFQETKRFKYQSTLKTKSSYYNKLTIFNKNTLK